MKPLEFREIAGLISLSRTTTIDEQPSSKGSGWEIYPGTVQVQGWRHGFQVLYLASSCTVEQVNEARAAAAIADGPIDNHVVYAPSLDNRHRTHHGLDGPNVKGVWNTRDYLGSFIAAELERYRTQLQKEEPQHYINPQIDTPSGVPRRLPNPLESFLTHRDGVKEEDLAGSLGILLAEPGQGKTYSTRHVATRLLQRSGVVPIYINSSQWRTMSVAEMTSFSKTLTHCFRHFGSSIGWLDGHEDEFVRVTLKAGLFTVIFDGFDEYVLWNRGEVEAGEVLDTVGQLAHDTGTSILMTSRTSFWEASIDESEAESPTDVLVYKLKPFDVNHAKNYFAMRCPARAEGATRLFEHLQELKDQFTGRGFILSLIADLAERGDGLEFRRTGGGLTVQWLIRQLCERERVRQHLPLTASEQIAALQLLAVEGMRGERLETALIEVAVSEARPELEGQEVRRTVAKLEHHPLLGRRPGDTWAWHEEQIEVVLLAEHLCQLSSSGEEETIYEFCKPLRLSDSTRLDVADAVVQVALTDRRYGEVLLKKVTRSLVGTTEREDRGGQTHRELCKLGVAIALRVVDRKAGHGESKKERRRILQDYCGGEILGDLHLGGQVMSMDFGGVHFRQCRFDRVVWANCGFDEGTVFERCYFVGGDLHNCTGFGRVQLKGSEVDGTARQWIDRQQAAEGTKRYGADHLKADIGVVLDKFVGKGGIGMRTVEARNLRRGAIRKSRHGDQVVEELTRQVLKEHDISGGTRTGYSVRSEAAEAVRFYADNNVFIGPVESAYRRLARKLRIELERDDGR